MKKLMKFLFSILLLILVELMYNYKDEIYNYLIASIISIESYEIENLPEYSGKEYVYINENNPNFTEKEKENTISFEKYEKQDNLGRSKRAYANISIDLMPTKKRESIGMIKPSGWQTTKYDFIDGKFLYNRCHLIGYQLTGENANKNNLITCTRSTNIGIMLEYENKVTKYIKETKNHVLYRVTPIYKDKDLIATGINMEGYSVEDKGKGINYNIFIYNVENGVKIDYKTGKSFISK